MEVLSCKTQLSNIGTGTTPIFMLKPENVTEMTEAQFLKKLAAIVNRIESATGQIVITGTGLAIDLNAADEGVWLANKDAGEVVKTLSVTSADSGAIRCTIGSLPENGQYRLTIATRDGDAKKSVRTVTHLETVEA